MTRPRSVSRNLILVFACLAFCLGVSSAGAFTPQNLVCPAPSNTSFSFDNTSVDLTIACALSAGSVNIRAHSITINGPNGSITTNGTAGITLTSFMSTGNHPGCLAGTASDQSTATIKLHSTDLEDQNNNGGIALNSCGSIVSDGGTKVKSADDSDVFHCFLTSPLCTITLGNNTFFGNKILILSQGDLTISDSSFETIGPNDRQAYVSFFGSVHAGLGCDEPEVLCGPRNEVCMQCQLCNGKNSFFGGVESSFLAFGMQFVDLNGACIDIAQNITIVADETNPAGAPNNFLAEPSGGGVNVSLAEVRNDFGKTGFILITGHPAWVSGHPPIPTQTGGNGDLPVQLLAGNGTVNIDKSILVDQGQNGGGTDPTRVSAINGGADFIVGNCVGVTPSCKNRAIPADGNIADPLSRSSHNATGAPKCDS